MDNLDIFMANIIVLSQKTSFLTTNSFACEKSESGIQNGLFGKHGIKKCLLQNEP